jgi:hypothetical protein
LTASIGKQFKSTAASADKYAENYYMKRSANASHLQGKLQDERQRLNAIPNQGKHLTSATKHEPAFFGTQLQNKFSATYKDSDQSHSPIEPSQQQIFGLTHQGPKQP